MVLIPWPSIWKSAHGIPLQDRHVYHEMIVRGHLNYDLDRFDDLSSYMSGEYIWGWTLNYLVRVTGMSSDFAFQIISTIIVFSASMLIVRFASPWYVLFLINPLFIDFAFSQLRLALAMAIMSWVILIRGRTLVSHVLRVMALLVPFLMHTSAVVFALLFAASAIIALKLSEESPWKSYVASVGVGLATALLLGPWRTILLGQVGDRRITHEYETASLKFSIIWLLLALVLTVTWGKNKPTFARSSTLAALTTALPGAFLGVYSSRVISVSLPIFFASIHSIPNHWKLFFLLAYSGYVTLHWFTWFGLMT